MTDRELDELLQKTLAPVEPRADLNQNLKRKMEDGRMKRFSVKKTVGLAAACCLLIGTVSVASSGIVASVISHSRVGEFTSFDQLGEAESKAGYSIHAVDTFSNGYQFDEMDIEYGQNMDENGNELGKYKGICISYSKQGQDSIHLNTKQIADIMTDETDRLPVTTTTVDGITISYYVDTYKWVPTDYELTPEDEANEQKGDYYISYGAAKVSENQVSYVVWEQGDVHYNLMNVNSATPAETMFEMAQEIIEAK